MKKINWLNLKIPKIYLIEIKQKISLVQEEIDYFCDKYCMRFSSHTGSWIFRNDNSNGYIGLYSGQIQSCRDVMSNKDSEKFIELTTLLNREICFRLVYQMVEDYRPGVSL